MAYANLSARVDVRDKIAFEEFCNETGMNVSVAINTYIKYVLKERKMPFVIEGDKFYSKKNISAIEENIEAYKRGEGVSKTMEELLAMENE
ncbi:MAG: type II toxin-antitoxin system RelB/DinJ family antitoxin [Fusobacterium sp.]|nr:type II toxin-antitoxin system RelB/DinJ family antitoxin [Fusobacterium sp.]